MRLAGVGTTQQVLMIKLQDANEEKVCQKDPGSFVGQDRRCLMLTCSKVWFWYLGVDLPGSCCPDPTPPLQLLIVLLHVLLQQSAFLLLQVVLTADLGD